MEQNGLNIEPNSFKYKSEQNINATKYQKKEKVINGNAVVKKKSDIVKLGDIIFVDDLHKIYDFAVKDVIIPSVKKAIYDIVTNGIGILLYSTDGNPNKNKFNTMNNSILRYGSFYEQPSLHSSAKNSYKKVYDYDTILYKDYTDANSVIRSMLATIDDYGFVKVSDYYDFSGVTGDSMSHNYGWTDLSNAAIIPQNGKYSIKLPKPMEVNKL